MREKYFGEGREKRKKMKVYEKELKRQIQILKSSGNEKTAKEIEKRLWRFRTRNPIRRFNAKFQEDCLQSQVIYELGWCSRQGQEECRAVLEDIRNTHIVDPKVMTLLECLNPLHQI